MVSNTVTMAYGGKAQINFAGSGGRHYYRVSVPDAGIFNLYQPGVSTIIGMKDKSAPLMVWAINCMVARIEQLINDYPDLKKLGKTALKSIVRDAKNSYRDVKDEAADIGSLVHRVLEQVLLARGFVPAAARKPLLEAVVNHFKDPARLGGYLFRLREIFHHKQLSLAFHHADAGGIHISIQDVSAVLRRLHEALVNRGWIWSLVHVFGKPGEVGTRRFRS
jgi:hypothetical protein